MSTKEEIAAAQAEQNFQIEMWKIRKLIKSLQLARGYEFWPIFRPPIYVVNIGMEQV